MKTYPTDKITTIDLDTGEPNGYIIIPTAEACRNFESYLDADELKFYKELPDIKRLMIAMSCNSFNALLSEMGKKY